MPEKCKACKFLGDLKYTACKNCKHNPDMEDNYKPMSIVQRIRAMSDMELVNFLWRFNDGDFEDVLPFCKNLCGYKDTDEITDEMCKQCLLEKLRQPCDEIYGAENL